MSALSGSILMISEYQKGVRREQVDVSARLENIDSFVGSETYEALPAAEQELIGKRYYHLRQYRDYLTLSMVWEDPDD